MVFKATRLDEITKSKCRKGTSLDTTPYLWGTPKLAGAGKMRKNHKGDQEWQEGRRKEVSQEWCLEAK